MNDPIVHLHDAVQKTAELCGNLACSCEQKTITMNFSRPVNRAKVIAKHETGELYGTVSAVEINENCVTLKMLFNGSVGSHYHTAVVLNVVL